MYSLDLMPIDLIHYLHSSYITLYVRTNYVFQPDDIVDVAVEKINGLLESFMGINDTELGLHLYDMMLRHNLR